MMTVNLDSDAGKMEMEVESLEDASKKLRHYTDNTGHGKYYCLRASHCHKKFGNVYQDGKRVAKLGYNGRILDKADY